MNVNNLDFKFIKDRIEEIVCNRCGEFTEGACDRCQQDGDISLIRILIEGIENGKIVKES